MTAQMQVGAKICKHELVQKESEPTSKSMKTSVELAKLAARCGDKTAVGELIDLSRRDNCVPKAQSNFAFCSEKTLTNYGTVFLQHEQAKLVFSTLMTFNALRTRSAYSRGRGRWS